MNTNGFCILTHLIRLAQSCSGQLSMPCWNIDAGENETATIQVKLKKSQWTGGKKPEVAVLLQEKGLNQWVNFSLHITVTAWSAFPTIYILNADLLVITYTFITSRLRWLTARLRRDSIWESSNDWIRVRYCTAMCWCQCSSTGSDCIQVPAQVEGTDQDLFCLTHQSSSFKWNHFGLSATFQWLWSDKTSKSKVASIHTLVPAHAD